MNNEVDHWRVDWVNGFGRVVRSQTFYDIDEARSAQQADAYREPASRGATVYADGSESGGLRQR